MVKIFWNALFFVSIVGMFALPASFLIWAIREFIRRDVTSGIAKIGLAIFCVVLTPAWMFCAWIAMGNARDHYMHVTHADVAFISGDLFLHLGDNMGPTLTDICNPCIQLNLQYKSTYTREESMLPQAQALSFPPLAMPNPIVWVGIEQNGCLVNDSIGLFKNKHIFKKRTSLFPSTEATEMHTFLAEEVSMERSSEPYASEFLFYRTSKTPFEKNDSTYLHLYYANGAYQRYTVSQDTAAAIQ